MPEPQLPEELQRFSSDFHIGIINAIKTDVSEPMKYAIYGYLRGNLSKETTAKFVLRELCAIEDREALLSFIQLTLPVIIQEIVRLIYKDSGAPELRQLYTDNSNFLLQELLVQFTTGAMQAEVMDQVGEALEGEETEESARMPLNQELTSDRLLDVFCRVFSQEKGKILNLFPMFSTRKVLTYTIVTNVDCDDDLPQCSFFDKSYRVVGKDLDKETAIEVIMTPGGLNYVSFEWITDELEDGLKGQVMKGRAF